MARSRAAPRTSSASRPSALPPAAATHTPHASHAAPAPSVTNVYVQRSSPMGGMGGGGGSGILGTMAAVAGGSVLGHGISNYLYGHNNQAPTQPAEAQELARTATQENHVCAPQLTGYAKCMEVNPNAPENCQWAWDYFTQCQKSSAAAQ